MMIWPALAWLVMRFAVCTAAPNTSRVSMTTGPKWQPIRIVICWPFDLEIRMTGDRRLHFDRGVDRGVAVGESGHDLVAHGLDDRAAVLLGRAAHDLDADRDLVPRRDVAQEFEQARAADDIGKENREFLFLAHAVARPRRGLHNSDYRQETGEAPKPGR